MNYSKAKLWIVGFCFLLSTFHLYANNGTIHYAYPVSNITVDGDLSDWPKDILTYPIETFLFGEPIENDEDIKAHFRVGFDLKTQMVYMAVETTDDKIVDDKSDEAEWNTHDIHNFYIDPTHSYASGSISHLVSQDFRRLAEKRAAESWDPRVQAASWDDVQVQIRRDGKQTTYEWSFYLGDEMKIGRSIGFEYEVIDEDPGEENFPSVLAIGPGTGKGFNPTTMSDLILLKKDHKLGTLKGKLTWEFETEVKVPHMVRIRSVENPQMWVMTKVDDDGNYEVKLPEGKYALSLPYAVRFGNEGKYEVMNDDLIHEASVKADALTMAPEFRIEEKPIPDLIPEKGVLGQFHVGDKPQLDRFMWMMMDYYKVPGVSLALVKDGKMVYHQTYGYRNYYTRERVNENTLFEAASVTKPVFGFAVNRLVERGEFDLDKPLHEYLPFEDIAKDERYKLMTGRHVLIHTSGLPNWGREMKETPGTKFGYSGEGFEYLKRAVAHVTGRDIEELVEEEVLKPLGILHTYFSRNEELVKVMANGHYDLQPNMYNIPTEPGMAHSMHTEAKTFTNFMIAILERKGLKPETYKEMLRPQTQTPSDDYGKAIGWDESFGLGIVSATTPYGKMYGHGGNNGDFRCQFEVFDEGKMGFAIFTNGNTGHLLVKALREYLITGKVGEVTAMKD